MPIVFRLLSKASLEAEHAVRVFTCYHANLHVLVCMLMSASSETSTESLSADGLHEMPC